MGVLAAIMGVVALFQAWGIRDAEIKWTRRLGRGRGHGKSNSGSGHLRRLAKAAETMYLAKSTAEVAPRCSPYGSAYGHGLFVGIRDFGSDAPFVHQTCCRPFFGSGGV